MYPYILIIFIGWQATALEFSSGYECQQVQKEVQKQLKDVKNSSALCFEKLGRHKKDA